MSDSTHPTTAPKLRLAMIGCGAIGQRRHLPEAADNARVEIVALCDPNRARATEIAARYGNPAVFTDVAEMLATARPDVVVVGTPNALHAAQSILALEAGCHVLVEKPMAGTLAEADAMIAAATKAGRKLMVGQNQRLMPPHVKAKKIFDSGVLGRALSFQTTFKHGGPEGWSVDGSKSWFFKRGPAVMGVCGDLGVHKVDLMQYLLGQRITEVAGFIGTQGKTFADGATPIEVDDTAFLSVRTEAGVIGTITVSWTHNGRTEDNGTTIYCERGTIEMATDPQFSVVVRFKDGTSEHYKTGAVATNAKQTNSGVLDAFVEAIDNDTEPPIPGREGRQALAVILAAFEAAREGRSVRVG